MSIEPEQSQHLRIGAGSLAKVITCVVKLRTSQWLAVTSRMTFFLSSVNFR